MATGFGVETFCLDKLQSGRLVRGKAVVVQAMYRRLITPRGTLRGGPDEENYGIDLAGFIGAVGYPTALAALPGIIRGELMKDERVADVVASVIAVRDRDATIGLTIRIAGTLQGEGESFELTVAASDTSVELLGGVAQ